MQDVISGQVKITCDNFASAYEQVKAGTVRALAVTSAERYPASPDIATVAESLPGFEVLVFHAYVAPAACPSHRHRVVAELQASLKDPDVQAKLKVLGRAAERAWPEPNSLTSSRASTTSGAQ